MTAANFLIPAIYIESNNILENPKNLWDNAPVQNYAFFSDLPLYSIQMRFFLSTRIRHLPRARKFRLPRHVDNDKCRSETGHPAWVFASAQSKGDSANEEQHANGNRLYGPFRRAYGRTRRTRISVSCTFCNSRSRSCSS